MVLPFLLDSRPKAHYGHLPPQKLPLNPLTCLIWLPTLCCRCLFLDSQLQINILIHLYPPPPSSFYCFWFPLQRPRFSLNLWTTLATFCGDMSFIVFLLPIKDILNNETCSSVMNHSPRRNPNSWLRDQFLMCDESQCFIHMYEGWQTSIVGNHQQP